MAHFKPFARAKAGPPSARRSRWRSYTCDSSYSYRRYRRRNSGLIVIDLG